MVTCSADDCDRPPKARGLCLMHYKRARRAGALQLVADEPPPDVRPPADVRLCAVEGCGRGHAARGWCHPHWKRWKTYGDPLAGPPVQPRRRSSAICRAPSCRRDANHSDLCSLHAQRLARTGSVEKQKPADRWLSRTGYVMVKRRGHPNAYANGVIAEHRVVMSEMLGRPLLPGENVHHRNGVRTDNRPENLELWVVSQPEGQRVEDVVAHARLMLERYGHLA